ncbi:MAG TPA: YfhO family protein [Chitinispirillaceae bacterium]|nr:YfhO family protein [Chitinispirillaceae bacterium]
MGKNNISTDNALVNQKKTPGPAILSFFKHSDFLAILFILLITIIYYWPVLSLSGTIWNDFIEQYLPYRMFATRALKALTFPFWNPYSFSGMPFFADLQTAVLYPFNLLLALFSNQAGTNAVIFEYQIIFHIFLAGTFTYLLARNFQRGIFASIAAALAFMFSGFATTHIFHISMIHSLPWLPLSLLLLRKSLKQHSFLNAALCGLSLAFLSLAGHPQMILYIHYLLGAYLLYHLYEIRRETPLARKWIIAISLFCVAIFSGIGISAVQLLPVRELSQESVRPKMTFEEVSEGSFRPYRFITMIVPNFFGIPNRQNSQATTPYWGMAHDDFDPGRHYYWETSMYVGIVTIVLSAVALILFRSPPLIFFFIISMLSLIIALGQSGGLYYIFYQIMPGFKMFRSPARIAIIFSLASALCAAFGFDGLIQQVKSKETFNKKNLFLFLGTFSTLIVISTLIFASGAFKTSITSFIINQGFFGSDAAQISQAVDRSIYSYATLQLWITAILFLLTTATLFALFRGYINTVSASVLLLILICSDMLAFGYGYCADTTDPNLLYKPNNLINSMHAEYKKEPFRFNSRSSAPGRDDISGGEMIFKRNEGTVHELFLMEGYNPLRLKRQLLERKDRTLDILNVKYKINVDRTTGQIGILPHTTAFPRVWFAHAYQVQNNELKILQDLESPSFNHKTSVILEEKPDFPSGNQNDTCISSVKMTSWGMNKITTQLTTDKPGFLVLSEIFYPAWKAKVDGKSTTIYRANYALRAIPVAAGNHTVICEYDDDSFKIGLIISLLSVSTVAGMIIIGIIQKRKRLKKLAS